MSNEQKFDPMTGKSILSQQQTKKVRRKKCQLL